MLDGLCFGKGFFKNVSNNGLEGTSFIQGVMSQEAIKGDKTIAVQKLIFSIPNLREFHGLPVKLIADKEGGIAFSSNRIILDNDNYTIKIDKSRNYKETQNSLDSKGGYIIQYGGELISKKGDILYEDTKQIFNSLSTFLSFINGRKTSSLFSHGIFENKTIWCDYTAYNVDIYNSAVSWTLRHSTNGLNELWQKFSEYWSDGDAKSFLVLAIHWYNVANINSGYFEGSIIMAQTALELIYNWLLIENKKILIGKDSENICAANKIRLLLSHLNINYDVPSTFSNLQLFVKDSKDIIDAPDAVVQIRNAIVHSQEEKRKKLSAIPSGAKHEALQLCLWYVEMSLLYILNFDNNYYNRCSHSEQLVPWSKRGK